MTTFPSTKTFPCFSPAGSFLPAITSRSLTKREKTKSNASGVVHVCETVPVCLHVHDHVSYDVLPLPVAPMIAFIPGLMIPLQQPTRKSSQHFDNLE